MNRYYKSIANAWYVKNLLSIGVHSSQMAEMLIQGKIDELKKRPKALIKNNREMFIGLKAKAKIIITGENVRMAEDLETLKNFATIEADPIRRTALIERAMRIKGIDVSGLPKSQPEALGGAISTNTPAVPLPATT